MFDFSQPPNEHIAQANSSDIKSRLNRWLIYSVSIIAILTAVYRAVKPTAVIALGIRPEELTLLLLGIFVWFIVFEVSNMTRAYEEIILRVGRLELASGVAHKIGEVLSRDREGLEAWLNNRINLDRIRDENGKEAERFLDIAGLLSTNNDYLLEGLSRGRVILPQDQAARIQKMLFNHYQRSFDAVSYRDVAFWRDEARSGEYTRVIGELMFRNSTFMVNRIFVLTVSELEANKKDIKDLLKNLMHTGVGWAIAVGDRMGKEIELFIERNHGLGVDLDFAICNKGEVATFFKKRDDPTKRYFEAAFCVTDKNRQLVEAQKKIFALLLNECWIASGEFAKVYTNDHWASYIDLAKEDPALGRQLDNRVRRRNLPGREESNDEPFRIKSESVDDLDERFEAFLLEIKQWTSPQGNSS